MHGVLVGATVLGLSGKLNNEINKNFILSFYLVVLTIITQVKNNIPDSMRFSTLIPKYISFVLLPHEATIMETARYA